MNDLISANFFRDRSVQDDPYPYFDAVRATSPVWQEPHFGVYLVTGHDEALAVYNDSARFSSCNVVSGPFMPFPEPISSDADDVTEVIARHREMLPFSDQLPSFDPPDHTAHRALMMRLLTPGRLRENEEFMAGLSERLLRELVVTGRCDVVDDYAKPFALLVVAELEGVPEEDHASFAEGFSRVTEEHAAQAARVPLHAVLRLHRGPPTRAPRRHHDEDGHGHVPRRERAGGQRRRPARRQPLHGRSGDDRAAAVVRACGCSPSGLTFRSGCAPTATLIPNFIEEMLRYESPLRAQFRMAKVRSRGGRGRHPRRQHDAAAPWRRQPRPAQVP